MVEINKLRGKVVEVVDANNIKVDINTSGFTAYVSGGRTNLISGVVENEGEIGVTLGTDVVGANADVLYYTAYLDDPIL